MTIFEDDFDNLNVRTRVIVQPDRLEYTSIRLDGLYFGYFSLVF